MSNRTASKSLLSMCGVWIAYIAILPQAVLGEEGANQIAKKRGKLSTEERSQFAAAQKTRNPNLLTADESQRLTAAITKVEVAETELSQKIESCWVRMQNMRATITEIKEIQVGINTVAYELRDRQGKLLGRVVKVNDQLDQIDGELGILVEDLLATAEEIGLLNQGLDLLANDVSELNCTLKQLGCNLSQLECGLKALSCDLCALDKAIRRGQWKAFIIGVIVGICIGMTISGGGSAATSAGKGGGGANASASASSSAVSNSTASAVTNITVQQAPAAAVRTIIPAFPF